MWCSTIKNLLLFLYIAVHFYKTFGKENGTYRIEIVRQKTPAEQYLNYGHLFGGNFSDLHKGKRDNDSISLYRFLDDEFYGKVIIGHPGQTLNVAFDVSWDISWVISSRCNSIKTIGCYFHNKYDHTKSSEYKKDDRPFNFDMGNYNLSGFYSYDNFSIAHSNVTTFSFVEMVNVPNEFLINKADGVLGLGLQTGSYQPFFYMLLSQKKIKNPIFSIYLNRDTQSNRGGNIMLGFIDDKHIHKTELKNKTVVPDTITYLNVDDNLAYWQFQMDKIVVNKKNTEGQFDILCANGCKAIVDTSSNTIIGPQEEIEKIHKATEAREFFWNKYTVDCDTINKLPKIDIIFGGSNFTLSGPDYTVKKSFHSITVCFIAFVPANAPQEQNRWILGGAFLAKYYSVYNVFEKKIGFVRAA